MKKKTKITLGVIAILIFAVIAIIAFMFVKDLKQEENLNTELASLYELLDKYPLNYEAIDTNLKQTVTSGDYAKVERAVKDYSGNFVTCVKQLDELFNNEALVNALSTDNIKEDGPDFTKTKQQLDDAKNSLDKIYSDLSSYFTEDKVMSYINDKNLDNYYIDLLKKYTFEGNKEDGSTFDLEAEGKEIISSLDEFKNLIATEQELVEFLIKNKRSWKVVDNELVFYSSNLTNQYNNLISKLKS